MSFFVDEKSFWVDTHLVTWSSPSRNPWRQAWRGGRWARRRWSRRQSRPRRRWRRWRRCWGRPSLSPRPSPATPRPPVPLSPRPGHQAAQSPSSARNCSHQTLGPRVRTGGGKFELGKSGPRQRLPLPPGEWSWSQWPNAWPRSILRTETRTWIPLKQSQVRVRCSSSLYPCAIWSGRET